MTLHFETKTLFLRPFEAHDVPALQAYLNLPHLAGRRYLPDAFPAYFPLSRSQVENLITTWAQQEHAITLAIVSQHGQQVIGHVGADWGWDTHCPGVHVVIDPLNQRNGYGRGALGLMLDYLFGYTPAHSVDMWVADWNKAGIAFAESMGFRPAGAMRWAGLHEGKPFDMQVFDLLRPEYLAQQKKQEEVSYGA
ncbi:MAG: N-acetyltransferase [Anaerolineae bacterium]|nr:MAG: N-acetyltransferase [Anaerolineae bacterium]